MIHKLVLLCLISMLFIHCKGKKTKLAESDTVTIEDFVDFFPVSDLPFQVTDSVLNKKETDTSSIDYPVFTQFIPDTVVSKEFGKLKPAFYPLGKAVLKNAETYLFVKAVTPGKKTGFILAFDKDMKYLASLPLLSVGQGSMPFQRGGMDKKYTITQTLEQKAEDGSLNESKNVFILNTEAHEFSKIMTDIGVSNQVQDIINPIDTFQRTNKFSGDYIKDKRNYISVRDGKNVSVVLFFIHFEKSDGECIGELKGEATINGVKTAVYRANGNPCVLELAFAGNHVTMKELEACGSYRDIKCFFEGSFTRKAEKQTLKKKKRA